MEKRNPDGSINFQDIVFGRLSGVSAEIPTPQTEIVPMDTEAQRRRLLRGYVRGGVVIQPGLPYAPIAPEEKR